jgi:hypothetical protein
MNGALAPCIQIGEVGGFGRNQMLSLGAQEGNVFLDRLQEALPERSSLVSNWPYQRSPPSYHSGALDLRRAYFSRVTGQFSPLFSE